LTKLHSLLAHKFCCHCCS